MRGETVANCLAPIFWRPQISSRMPSLTKHLLAGLCGGVLLFCASQIGNAQENARLKELVELCAACHGENGLPQEKTTPIIWGQTLGYQYLQLRDYKNGDRKN